MEGGGEGMKLQTDNKNPPDSHTDFGLEVVQHGGATLHNTLTVTATRNPGNIKEEAAGELYRGLRIHILVQTLEGLDEIHRHGHGTHYQWGRRRGDVTKGHPTHTMSLPKEKE